MPDLATPARAVPALAIDGLTYAYPNAGRPALRDVDLQLGFRGVRPPRRPLRLRQVDPPPRRLRPRPALPRRRDRGPHRGSGHRRDSQGPRRAGRSGRLRRPGPRDPGRLDHSRGGDRAAAGDARGPTKLPRESRGGGRSRPGDSAPPRPSRGHPLRRRAPTRRPCGGLGHPPAPRAPRRAHLPAGPGCRRRADLAPAPPQRGVGGDHPPRRAPPGALPGRRRPSHRDGFGLDRLRWPTPRLPHLGAGVRHSPGDPRRAPLLSRRNRTPARRSPRCAPHPRVN